MLKATITHDVPTRKRCWHKEEIQNLIKTNDKMVQRSLLKLYECQTEDEKTSKLTKEENGIGFNEFDSYVLSDIAEFCIKTGFLTAKQIQFVRRKIYKYAGQLTKIANGEI